MVPEIATSKPDLSAKAKKKTILKHNWEIFCLKENHQRQNWENLLTDHYRNLDAATPIRFTRSSCKKQ